MTLFLATRVLIVDETGSVAIFYLLFIVGVVDPRLTSGTVEVVVLVWGFDAFLNVDAV